MWGLRRDRSKQSRLMIKHSTYRHGVTTHTRSLRGTLEIGESQRYKRWHPNPPPSFPVSTISKLFLYLLNCYLLVWDIAQLSGEIVCNLTNSVWLDSELNSQVQRIFLLNKGNLVQCQCILRFMLIICNSILQEQVSSYLSEKKCANSEWPCVLCTFTREWGTLVAGTGTFYDQTDPS